MSYCKIGATLVMALACAWSASSARAQEPVWYPPSEPSPFVPDDARRIGGGTGKTVHFRGTWQIGGPVERAVLMTAPMQTTRVYLNGRLVLEAHDSHQALPVWAEVTDRLRPGDAFVAGRVYSDWRPMLYAQMRVEYRDGTWEDVVTGAGWEWTDEPGDDWASDRAEPGDWRPVEEVGGYYREGGGFWQHEFALLPREMLRARFEAHNARLRQSWPEDRQGPGPEPAESAERPEWREQFSDFCRVDDESGQLMDGAGRVRHLFFTIYNQQGKLSVREMDLEQLERDLDLMAQADVHLYMRMLGWGWLLTAQGEWATLEQQPSGAGDLRFERGIDLLDHLVRRAWAHGRYIVFEGDFFWSAHGDVVPPPYRSRYHLYPEVLEAQALATRKIMGRYAKCANVLGMMIGEEDIQLEHDLDNPHQHAMFVDFLRRKHGTLDAFKRETPRGYDYEDRSGYVQRARKAEYWPEAPEEEALVPQYSARGGVFEGVQKWTDIPLPLWPRFLSAQEPDVTLGGCKSYNQFTPQDPLWIDFYEMREDELLFGMLQRWAQIVREAMPRQLLFYSNAQDFTNSWHFLHLFRRAELPFDAIGVGCHDSGKDLSEIPAWATVRKAIKVVSSYRPYVLAPGSPARGVASGEGEGGRHEHPEEVLNYYRGALFDEIGGGAAWTQTYTWLQVSGAHGDASPHETPLLKWMGEFMPAVQGVAFPLRRPVQVLIVRNTNLAHSNMSGLDYGNALSVAEALTQLNVEFDIVMDRDLAYGAADGATHQVDLAPYRLVILPSVAIDHPEPVWEALDGWLSDPAGAGERVLALGWIANRGPRLQPTEAFHPRLQRWLGCAGYEETEALQGKQRVVLSEAGEAREMEIDFGRVPPTGVLDQGEAILRTPEGKDIATRIAYRGNAVCAFGFPMGFAHEPLWGLAPQQEPRDAVVPIYEALVRAAGMERPILAPHNLRVYVAEGGRMVLVRERGGLKTAADVAVRIPEGVEFAGLALTRDGEGYARFKVDLQPWEGRWWKAGE